MKMPAGKNKNAIVLLRTVLTWSTISVCVGLCLFVILEGTIIVVEKLHDKIAAHKGGKNVELPFTTQGVGHREPVPYYMFFTKPDLAVEDRYFGRQRSHLVTNNMGFRYSDDISAKKADGVYRIFLLGGSVVFSATSNETAISSILEKKLNERVKHVSTIQCINAGVASFISDQELALLVHRIIDLDPDLIIVFDGFNDIWFPFYYEPRVSYPINWTAYENAFQNNNNIRKVLHSINFFKGIRSTSRLITRFRPDLSLENSITHSFYQETAIEHPPPSVSEIVDHLSTNWTKMYHFARSYSVDMVCILQPCNPKVREEPFVNDFYTAMNARIAKAHQEQAMPWFTFDRMLDAQQSLFVPGDPVHTWDTAHELYAAAMIRTIDNSGLIK